MAQIDSLEIQIAGSVKKANNAINSLIENLGRLANSLKIDTSKLDNIGKNINLGNVSKGAKNIKSQMDNVEKSAQKAKKAMSGIEEIKASISTKDFDSAVESLQKRFQDSGKNFEFKGNSSQLEQEIKKLEKELNGLYERQEEFKDLGSNINTEDFIKLQRRIALVNNHLRILKEELSETSSASVELVIDRDSSTTLDYFKKSLSRYGVEIDRISKKFNGIFNVPKGEFDFVIDNLKTDISNLEALFPDDTEVIDKFKNKLSELQKVASGLTKEPIEIKINSDASGKVEEVKKEVDDAKESIKEASLTAEKFEEYLENIKIPEIRETNLKKLQAELEKTERKLEELNATAQDWGNKGVNPDSAKFRNLWEEIAKTEKKSDALQKKISEVGKIEPNVSGWQKLTELASIIDKSFSAIKRGVSSALNSIKKLGRGFQNLGSIVKKVSSAIGKMFSNIVQLAGKATSAITSSVKGMTSAFSKLRSESSGIQRDSSGFSGLVKAAGGLLAAKGIVDFGKEAVELGSNITEVENVVDTAFGSMAGKVYDFASTAKEQFGLSELSAKQYAGTMMAMLKSSGVAQGAASDMSIALAGLAGDLASFYNIDTDTAFQKLRAGISGETEPLKQLGINMNIVNLEAYAMSQGITKAYKDMTLAEQSILRYNYILAKTGDAQGDFARTAGTWANQLRLLRLNIQSISAIIGQGLIAALLPAIKLLNKFMSKLTEAAKKFRDFMYVLFGKKIESPMRGVVDDMAGMTDYTTDLSGISNSAEDVGDGMDDASEGMDSATESAKKLKKALSVLGFDELHQLNKDLDDLDISKTNGDKNKDKDLGLDDIGIGDLNDAFDDLYDKAEIEPINEWARRLREAFLNHDWEGLGKTIAEMVNIGLKKIYDGIKKITPKVEKALKAFAKVFNSFVKWLDWDLLGRTIGAGINLLSKAFNALFGPGGIDLEQLGRKLSVGLRGMIDEVNWRELGNAIGNYFMIAWRIASGFVEDMWRINPDTLLTGWAETGIALAEGIHGIFERINFAQIGKTLADGFNGITEIIRNFRNQMADNGTWSMIAENISNGLNNLFEIDLAGFAQQASGLVLDILYMLNDAAERTNWSDFGYKIAEALFSIPWLTLFNQVFDFLAATFGEALGGFVNYLTAHAEQLGQSFADVFNTLFAKIKYIASNIPWDDIGEAISKLLNTSIAKIRPGQAAVSLGNFVTSLLDTMLKVAEETHWEDLGRKIGNFLTTIPWQTIIGQVFDTITSIFGGLITGLGGSITAKLPEIGTAMADGFNHAFQKLGDFVASVEWKDIGHSIATGINNMIHGIKWEEAGKTLSDFVKSLLDVFFVVAVETDWASLGKGIGDFLDSIDWGGILGRVAGTISNILMDLIPGLFQTTSGKIILFLGHLWAGIKGFGLVQKVAGLAGETGGAFGLIPDGITSIIPSLSGGVEGIAGAGGILSKLFTGASGIVSKIGPILGSIGSVIFSPQGALIVGIIAGVGAIIANWDKIKEAASKVKDWVSEKWEGLKEKTNEIWGNTSEQLGTVWGGMNSTAGSIFGKIAGNVTTAWSSAQTDTSNSWGQTQESLNGSLQAMDTAVNVTMESIKAKINLSMAEISASYITGWQNIAGASNGVLQQVQTGITMMMQSIKGIIMVSMQEIGGIFTMGWQAVSTATLSIIQQIISVVFSCMANMQASIIVSMQQISAIFANAWQSIGNMSMVATAKMQEDVTAKMQSILNTVNNTMKSIQNAYSAGWRSAQNTTSSSLSTINSTVSAKMNAIKSAVTSAMTNVQNVFKTKWTEIGNATTQNLNKIQSTITTKMNEIKSKITSSMTDIQNTFKTKLETIGNTCKSALDKMKSTVTEKMNSIKTTVSNGMNSIATSYRSGMNKLPNITSDAIGNVVREFQKLPNKISSSVNSNMFTAGQNAAKSFANGIKSIHIPTPHIRVASWTQHRAGDTTYSTPNFGVNWYAKGGLAYNPSIVGIGEAGKEAILPLENKRTMGMIAESIMNSYSGSGIDKDMLSNAVAEGVVMALMNNIDNLTSNNQQPINITVKLENDEAIARAAIRGQKSIDYRMNPTPQMAY